MFHDSRETSVAGLYHCALAEEQFPKEAFTQALCQPTAHGCTCEPLKASEPVPAGLAEAEY